MATDTCIRAAAALAATFGAVAAFAVATSATPGARPSPFPDDGRDEFLPVSTRPGIEAAFERESYAAGDVARLRVFTSAQTVVLDVVHAGLETHRIRANDVLAGLPVSRPRALAEISRGQTIQIRIGRWPSGLYFARLNAAGRRVGYATFVLRPRRLGEHRLAVVLPTQTWQAYNFHDDDGDGTPDTWYAGGGQTTARLARPIYNRGVPPHYKYYDQPFLRWLHETGKDVDFLSDGDLIAVRAGAELARAYDLVVFEGHHEYVTAHEYDVVTAYRNRGGNLMFLSANNFYWKITRSGNLMTRIAKWRDLGRPEAALVGVQFFHNDDGEHRGPWRVRTTAATPWLFKGTGLHSGATFGSGGIEADATTSASPRSVHVIATIPNLFRTGQSAEMTYYETSGGAKVFAAGAFTLAGLAQWPQVRPLLENLWTHLERP